MVENSDEKYLVFTVQDKQYALPSKIISEVAVLEKVFPLPLVPGYVRGIINRYSVPYALIDINFLFLKDASAARKIIVLKEEVDKLAFLIDDVIDIADLNPEQIMKTEQEDGSISGFFEWNNNHVLCLDAGELISRIKQDFQQ
ncbi:MAG: chemotaxis protein CheW [Spirochaetes bacterium]|nr:chemotaxis protein CheW [Spirochaetota bacterium]